MFKKIKIIIFIFSKPILSEIILKKQKLNKTLVTMAYLVVEDEEKKERKGNRKFWGIYYNKWVRLLIQIRKWDNRSRVGQGGLVGFD